MRSESMALGQKLRKEGLDMVQVLSLTSYYEEASQMLDESKPGPADKIINELTAIGLILSKYASDILMDMLDVSGDSVDETMKIVKFVDKMAKWNQNALMFVANETLNPDIKREVSEFFAEVDQDGGF